MNRPSRLIGALILSVFLHPLAIAAPETTASTAASIVFPAQADPDPAAPIARLASPAFLEVLVAPADGQPEQAALEAAVARWAARSDPLDRGALTDFLAQHPDSPWTAALLGNLGLQALEEGRFSQALTDLDT
ncbi:MAG: hypothetical protein LBB76_04955, partial [Azoarcus sp.]|nr:hypothetical protein [Azoarcus sp.]